MKNPLKDVTYGHVINTRDFKNHCFVITSSGGIITQCVLDKSLGMNVPAIGSHIEVQGDYKPAIGAPGGIELALTHLEVLAEPSPHIAGHNPISLSIKPVAGLDIQLDNRAISLRNIHTNAIFRVKSVISNSFRDFFSSRGAVEIHTPKIVQSGAEGGAAMFKLKYFGQDAYLSQSPQLYKQIAAGAFESVFEIGPVFRAENSQTSRHLTEYTGLDFESIFTDDLNQLMEEVRQLIEEINTDLIDKAFPFYKTLGVNLPDHEFFFSYVTYEEGLALVAKHKIYTDDKTIDKAIGEAVFKEQGNDWVFVTHFPAAVRPFYTKKSADPHFTESFDLLYKGLEVCSGSIRINDYKELCAAMTARGLRLDLYKDYLQAFEQGMPPHGGAGFGLERLTKELLGLGNIKEASMFPRDVNRLTP